MKVVLTVDTNTYFKSQWALASGLQRNFGDEPVLYFSRPYPQLEQHVALAMADGIEIYRSEVSEWLGDRASTRGWLNLALDRLAPPLAAQARLRAVHADWTRFLGLARPDAVILPAENRYEQNLLALLARERGVRVIVVPLWMAGPAELLEGLRNDQRADGSRWGNRILLRFSPRWGGASGTRILVAQPWGDALARELMGCAPEQPWVLHDGFADVIAAESEGMIDLGERAGIPRWRMTCTGSVFHDEMAANLPRSGRQSGTGVTRASQPLEILTALPPDMFESRRGLVPGLTAYEDLVDRWCETLCARADTRVILSIHPTADLSSIRLPAYDNLTITQTPIEYLLPNCDVFVASISATIQWALACGKPVVNYDVYQYGYRDYFDEPNVERCTTLEDFADAVDDVLARVRVGSRSAIADVSASRWGRLDGGALKRVRGLLIDPAAPPVSD